MTREQVENFAQMLPAASPYFERVFGNRPSERPPSEWERIDKALLDPAFGWNVAASYPTMVLPLPDLDWPTAIVRAHRYLGNPNLRDDNLVFAQILNLPENGAQRGLMHALLLCEDGTDELIADWFQCGVDAVGLHSELFWNVRDRHADPLYLAHILQDNDLAGRSLREGSQAQFGLELVRLASRTGKAQTVLAAAGVARAFTDRISVEARIEQILHKLLVLAATGLANQRKSAQENRALALLCKYQLLSKTQAASGGTDSLSLFRFSHADLQPLYEDLSRRLGLERAPTQDPAAANRQSSA